MSNFKSAKKIYIDKIAMPGFNKEIPLQDPHSKYARAAKLGLCFHCFREDENPKHRPTHRMFAFCPECYADMGKGVEALEAKSKREVEKWFGDK